MGNAISWDEKGLDRRDGGYGYYDGLAAKRVHCHTKKPFARTSLSSASSGLLFFSGLPNDARAGWEARGPSDARAWGQRQAVQREPRINQGKKKRERETRHACLEQKQGTTDEGAQGGRRRVGRLEDKAITNLSWPWGWREIRCLMILRRSCPQSKHYLAMIAQAPQAAHTHRMIEPCEPCSELFIHGYIYVMHARTHGMEIGRAVGQSARGKCVPTYLHLEL